MNDINKPTVLVIDDAKENIDILLDILGEEYQIRAALSGMDALDLVAKQPPEIILLDIMMPEMNGYEVCRRLKSSTATHNIPVVFITALSGADSESKGLEIGAVDYISKPFSPAIVLARVQTHLALSNQRRDLEKQVKKRTLELEKSRTMLDSANRAKSAFLANMSHELLTPLNHIQGFSDLLQEMVKEPEQAEMMDCIHSGVINLASLFKNLLNLSLIESGQVEISNSSFELNSILSRFETVFSAYAKGLGCSFGMRVEKDLPMKLQGARVETEQILNNLFLNAFRYTNKGDIYLEVFQDQDNYADLSLETIMICFVVRDTGVGISEDKLETIFNSFEIGEHFMTKRFSGSGIGLTISKYLTEKMDGRIWAESEVGAGSSFYVSLPFRVHK